jgi:hypothetical protein
MAMRALLEGKQSLLSEAEALLVGLKWREDGVRREEWLGASIHEIFCHVSFKDRRSKCPTDVVAEVESSFRAADTSANTMSVKRPAPGDGATSGDASDEASKRAKLDDKQGGQGGQQ